MGRSANGDLYQFQVPQNRFSETPIIDPGASHVETENVVESKSDQIQSDIQEEPKSVSEHSESDHSETVDVASSIVPENDKEKLSEIEYQK